MTATATATEIKGSWREIRAIEVTRPCGCVEHLFGKDAIPSRADKLTAKACWQCQYKARKVARLMNAKGTAQSVAE
jgi:hypothetical protein